MPDYTRNIDFWLTTNRGDEPENAQLLLSSMEASGACGIYKIVQQRDYTVVQGPVSMLILDGDEARQAFLLRLKELAMQPEE